MESKIYLPTYTQDIYRLIKIYTRYIYVFSCLDLQTCVHTFVDYQSQIFYIIPVYSQVVNEKQLVISVLRNPKLMAYIDFIYSATMYLLQLNQSYLLLTLFIPINYNLFLTSCVLRPSHGQLHELTFLFSHQGSHFLKRHSRSFVKLAI